MIGIDPRDPDFGLKITQQFQRMRDAQIGHVCRQWASLEYILAATISSLLRLDKETSFIVTNGLDILPRASMAHRLAVHLKAPPPAIKTLREVRDALRNGLLERRNEAVHAHRQPNPNDFSTDYVTMYRGKGAGVRRTQDHEALTQLGLDIAYVSIALSTTLMRCGVYEASLAQPARIMAKKTSRKIGPSES
jgi:hypothetical protein